MSFRIVCISVIFFFQAACKDNGPKDYEVSSDGLTWIDINRAGNIANTDNKMYMIDVYTDWCGWCKTMDRNTFSDKEVIDKLKEKFHVVKFNAEMKESLKFDGKEYKWQEMGRGGVNELAIQLLGGNMAYPSIVFLDKSRKPIQVVRGYKDAKQFLAILGSI